MHPHSLPFLLAFALAVHASPHPWELPHAQPLPQGDLAPAPKPYTFEAGPVVRYIDFDSGDDSNPGDSHRAAWKHHPWDPAATGRTKTSRGPVTYAFKPGVIYRGVLRPGTDRGEPGNPIRLATDPTWGTGQAIIAASEPVIGWTRSAHPKMPDAPKIWSAKVRFLPRTLWAISKDGTITRMKLARTPNWSEPDPNDVLSEWWTWENPEWWKGKGHTMSVDGKNRHLGISKERLTGSAEDYVGATVWSEWGIVMGSPYPAKVEAFDPERKGVAFRGPWTFEMSEKIIRGNRFYLEDKPQWLDEPGEFWVERQGRSATIYARFPRDADPSSFAIEAGHHPHILDAEQLHHVEIAGLTFRFTNVHWDYNIPRWAHPDLMAGVIRLNGSGDGIVIRHCTFEHVNMPVRIAARSVSDHIGSISIRDNTMRDTEHGAIAVDAKFERDEIEKHGAVGSVEILRNSLERIGWRILSGEHGHAIQVNYPKTSHIAGNFLHRIAGWGIAVFGGKPSGQAGNHIPFNRHLIHHNRVEDVLLKSNDWGGIETWQGGPFFVWNNLVINPIGFKNWIFTQGNKDNSASFGHAYYLDAGFKNYYFNNIAAGRNNTLGTKSVNTTALQNIISFENWFFHNTFYKFAEVTRQQAPAAGRTRYLGNIIQDASKLVFRHADPKDVAPDPNASHYTQGGAFAYSTLAYAGNVFHDIRGRFGVFEETGAVYDTADDFRQALVRAKAQVSSLGLTAETPPLVGPERGDFRPAPNGPAYGNGFDVFVPWPLYDVAGEWSFVPDPSDPARVMDEHWNMTGNYAARDEYKNTPRYPLRGEGITSASFVDDPLQSYAPGAARLDGKQTFFRLTHADLGLDAPPESAPVTADYDTPFAILTAPASIRPGQPFEIVVETKTPLDGQQLRADLHWNRKTGFGSFDSPGGNPRDLGGNRFAFTLKPGRRDGPAEYTILLYLTPDGTFENHTAKHNVPIPRAKVAESGDPRFARTVDIAQGNLLIEVWFNPASGAGTIARKMETVGYALGLADGKPEFTLRDASGTELIVTGKTDIAPGKWHHLIAEADRASGAASIYLDGEKVETVTTGTMPAGSLSNTADFLVGGGPGAKPLAADLGFLRVARGTLADAQTDIAELYAWQFSGPQFRDFTGKARPAKNAAGALAP